MVEDRVIDGIRDSYCWITEAHFSHVILLLQLRRVSRTILQLILWAAIIISRRFTEFHAFSNAHAIPPLSRLLSEFNEAPSK